MNSIKKEKKDKFGTKYLKKTRKYCNLSSAPGCLLRYQFPASRYQ